MKIPSACSPVTGPFGLRQSTLAEDILTAGREALAGESPCPKGRSSRWVGRAAEAATPSISRRSAARPAATPPRTRRRDAFARFAVEPQAAKARPRPPSRSTSPDKGRCENVRGGLRDGRDAVPRRRDALPGLPGQALQRRGPQRAEPRPDGGRRPRDDGRRGARVSSPPETPRERDRALERMLAVKVGLGLPALGQPLNDALRRRSAAPQARARALGDTEGTLFVVDEPSAGLHAADADAWWRAPRARRARRRRDRRARSVVGREADWVIDLGPGGPTRRQVVAKGRRRTSLSATKTGPRGADTGDAGGPDRRNGRRHA